MQIEFQKLSPFWVQEWIIGFLNVVYSPTFGARLELTVALSAETTLIHVHVQHLLEVVHDDAGLCMVFEVSGTMLCMFFGSSCSHIQFKFSPNLLHGPHYKNVRNVSLPPASVPPIQILQHKTQCHT